MASSRVADPKVLVVFDFDETLSSIHLFHEMARRARAFGGRGFEPEQRACISKASEEEVIGFFGGQARLQALGSWLESLHGSGARLAIVSFGFRGVIRDALQRAGLGRLFPHELIFGRDELQVTRSGALTPEAKARQVLELASSLYLSPSSIVFVDDDPDNVDEVIRWPKDGGSRFRGFHVAGASGLTQEDMSAVSGLMEAAVRGEPAPVLNESRRAGHEPSPSEKGSTRCCVCS